MAQIVAGFGVPHTPVFPLFVKRDGPDCEIAKLFGAQKQELAAAFFDLPEADQDMMLRIRWEKCGGPAMIPVLKRIYQNPGAHIYPPTSGIALRRLYELDPVEGRRLIVSEIESAHPRVGIEALNGYLQGGVDRWKAAGLPIERTAQISPQELESKLHSCEMQVLDVRREPEWEAGHIETATWWPLDNFKVSPPEIDHEAPLAVHCKGGYRSMIASSLLKRAGFTNIFNVAGGFDAWQAAGLSVVTPVTAKG